MNAGRVNVLLGLTRYQRPGYRPSWQALLAAAVLWAVIFATWWAL